MKCPHCGKTINPAALLGAAGGAAGRGKAKSRGSAAARRAAQARWAKKVPKGELTGDWNPADRFKNDPKPAKRSKR